VYCIEQADNLSARDVWNIMLLSDNPLKAEWVPELLNGVMIIQGEALITETESFKNSLYQSVTDISFKTRKVRLRQFLITHGRTGSLGPMFNEHAL